MAESQEPYWVENRRVGNKWYKAVVGPDGLELTNEQITSALNQAAAGEALTEYLQHKRGCDRADYEDGKVTRCRCGFVQALTAWEAMIHG